MHALTAKTQEIITRGLFAFVVAVALVLPTTTPIFASVVARSTPLRCTTGELSTVPISGDGAAGTIVERFSVTNKSHTTCTMRGYASVSLYGKQKQDGATVEATLTTKVLHIAPSFGDIGKSGGIVRVRPGERAVFFLEYSDVTQIGGCHPADGIDFKPPKATNWGPLVRFSFKPCGTQVEISQIFSSTKQS